VPPLGVETYENQKQAGLHYTLDGHKLNSAFKGGHCMSSGMMARTAVEQKNTLLPSVSKFYANCYLKFIS
jgi:hypothetical protein